MLMCFDVNERNVPLRVPDGPPCSGCRYKNREFSFSAATLPRVAGVGFVNILAVLGMQKALT